MSTFRTVSLPEELCAAAEQKFRGRFRSLPEMVRALLEELVRDDTWEMDVQEQKIIEERLKGLGYI